MHETRKTAAVAHTALNLPAQPISEEVLLEKYAKGDERSIDDVQRAWRARWRRPSRPSSARSGKSASPPRWTPASSRPGASTRPPAPTCRPR